MAGIFTRKRLTERLEAMAGVAGTIGAPYPSVLKLEDLDALDMPFVYKF